MNIIIENITEDTNLEDILESEEVINIITSTNQNIQKLLKSRIQILTEEMVEGNGLSTSIQIEGEDSFYKKAEEIKNNYSNIVTDLELLTKKIIYNAVTREKMELETLQEKCKEKENSLRKTLLELITSYEISTKENNLPNQNTIREEKIRQIKKELEETNEKLGLIQIRLRKLLMTFPVHDAPPIHLNPIFPYINKGEYRIDVENLTAEEIQEKLTDLESELGIEIGYMTAVIANIQYDLELLKYKYNKGLLGDLKEEEYKTMVEEYEKKIKSTSTELEKRKDVSTELGKLTKNKKIEEKKLPEIKKQIEKINEKTDEFNSLSNIGKDEKTGRRPFRMLEDNIGDDEFHMTFSNEFVDYISRPSTQNSYTTTMKAAYYEAKARNEYQEISDGVYVYSTKEYLINNPKLETIPTYSDYKVSELSSYYDSIVTSSGDTVYDSNTNQYYSYGEWLEKKNS